jgi:hypothetical protein
MLITLNDLGKFFYKSTNEFLDCAGNFLVKTSYICNYLKNLGRCCDCCWKRIKRKRIQPDQSDTAEKGELLRKESTQEDDDKKKVSFNLK